MYRDELTNAQKEIENLEQEKMPAESKLKKGYDRLKDLDSIIYNEAIELNGRIEKLDESEALRKKWRINKENARKANNNYQYMDQDNQNMNNNMNNKDMNNNEEIIQEQNENENEQIENNKAQGLKFPEIQENCEEDEQCLSDFGEIENNEKVKQYYLMNNEEGEGDLEGEEQYNEENGEEEEQYLSEYNENEYNEKDKQLYLKVKQLYLMNNEEEVEGDLEGEEQYNEGNNEGNNEENGEENYKEMENLNYSNETDINNYYLNNTFGNNKSVDMNNNIINNMRNDMGMNSYPFNKMDNNNNLSDMDKNHFNSNEN